MVRVAGTPAFTVYLVSENLLSVATSVSAVAAAAGDPALGAATVPAGFVTDTPAAGEDTTDATGAALLVVPLFAAVLPLLLLLPQAAVPTSATARPAGSRIRTRPDRIEALS